MNLKRIQSIHTIVQIWRSKKIYFLKSLLYDFLFSINGIRLLILLQFILAIWEECRRFLHYCSNTVAIISLRIKNSAAYCNMFWQHILCCVKFSCVRRIVGIRTIGFQSDEALRLPIPPLPPSVITLSGGIPGFYPLMPLQLT